jgi:hypothetical protein
MATPKATYAARIRVAEARVYLNSRNTEPGSLVAMELRSLRRKDAPPKRSKGSLPAAMEKMNTMFENALRHMRNQIETIPQRDALPQGHRRRQQPNHQQPLTGQETVATDHVSSQPAFRNSVCRWHAREIPLLKTSRRRRTKGPEARRNLR